MSNGKEKKVEVKVEKLDLGELAKMGIIFKSKSKKSMKIKDADVTIESFCVVSNDGEKWKYFNLYDGTLGKKARTKLNFGDKDSVKQKLSGDLNAISEYLEKKGYAKVE